MPPVDRARAESFGQDAAGYDRFRPSYPAALVDFLVTDRPIDTLDVGCGTGIAAQLFVDRGCRVLGIEPDERMAAVARARGIDVEIARFEAWDANERQFDLVTSGQAWHWVDPVLGVQRIADVLRPGGRFGCFWNWATLEPDLRSSIVGEYERRAISRDAYYVAYGLNNTGLAEQRTTSFVEHGAFDDVEMRMFPWVIEYTRDAWLEQLRTQSGHRLLPEKSREDVLAAVGDVIDSRGGMLPVQFETWLVTGYRRPA
jgi:SAM-dependent methyltransferase